MGLINGESFENPYGVDVSNTYISLGDNEIHIRKEDGKWYLEANYNVWHSKEVRFADKPAYDGGGIRIELTDDNVGSNVFTLVYTEIKKTYTVTSDDL